MPEAPAIISEGDIGTRIMRGRDVEYELRGEVSPKVLKVLVALAEINHTNVQAVAELATMQAQFVDMMQKFTDVADNMKKRTDQMARAMGQVADEAEGDQLN